MRKQILYLLLIATAMWVIGNGFLPLLPVYSAQLGGEVGMIGLFVSGSFVMLAIATFLAGWLSDRVPQRKRMLIAAGLMHSLTLFFMSLATNFAQFALATAASWFMFGFGITLLNIMAGLSAAEDQRGRIFGLIALTGGIGLLIGGLVFGGVADHWGYPTLLRGLAVFSLVWPFVALLLEEPGLVEHDADQPELPGFRAVLGKNLNLILLSSTLIWVGFFLVRFAISYSMDELSFSSSAISSTGAVAGAITLPLPFILGWLSDRLGRKPILMAICFVALVAIFVLQGSSLLWQFWLVITLISAVPSISAIGNAMVTDIVPAESLGAGLSLFAATTWFAGILSFALTGIAIEQFGYDFSIAIGLLIPVVAFLALIPLDESQPTAEAAGDAAL